MLSRLAAGSLAFSRVGSLAWNGLMRGLVIGLAGVGLSMTYSTLNFANFAHGDTITAGAFSGWAVTDVIAGFGVVDIGTLALVGTSGSQFGITATGTPLAVLAGAVFAGLLSLGPTFVGRIVDQSFTLGGALNTFTDAVAALASLEVTPLVAYALDSISTLRFVLLGVVLILLMQRPPGGTARSPQGDGGRRRSLPAERVGWRSHRLHSNRRRPAGGDRSAWQPRG